MVAHCVWLQNLGKVTRNVNSDVLLNSFQYSDANEILIDDRKL